MCERILNFGTHLPNLWPKKEQNDMFWGAEYIDSFDCCRTFWSMTTSSWMTTSNVPSYRISCRWQSVKRVFIYLFNLDPIYLAVTCMKNRQITIARKITWQARHRVATSYHAVGQNNASPKLFWQCLPSPDLSYNPLEHWQVTTVVINAVLSSFTNRQFAE